MKTLGMGDHDTATMHEEPEPALVRQEIATAPSETSIWTSVQDEITFRQAAVDLALATGECPWDAHVGLPPLAGAPGIDDYLDLAPAQSESGESYILSEQLEHRLANDFALLAASKEAVFSVTAACIQEHADPDGTLAGLKLLLAANEGVSEELRSSLAEIWNCLSASTSEDEIVKDVFAKIVHLNRLRIYQRVRKAVGHPPIFREKGRTRTNPDDKLARAFTRMPRSRPSDKWKPPAICHELVKQGLALNTKLLELLANLNVDEIEEGSSNVVGQLETIVKACFNATTDNGRIPFKRLLAECELDARLWLKNKYIGEVDKIGAYWRIANSLRSIYRHISRGRPQNLPPINLEIEGVQPYISVVNEPSIQGRPMPCYVHAEVQLVTQLAQQERIIASTVSSTRAIFSSPPRIIGASKSACFLCFLFLSCYRGPKTPATHGRLYDQWTVPDLAAYTPAQTEHLRETLLRMRNAMVRLREEYCLKKHRDHPMTSRVDVDRLDLFSEKGYAHGCHKEDEDKLDDDASARVLQHETIKKSTSVNGIREAGRRSTSSGTQKQGNAPPDEKQIGGPRTLFERFRVTIGRLSPASQR